MRSLVVWLVACVTFCAIGCTSAGDSPEEAGCVPGNGAFGARCCDPADCTGADLECRASQCTKACDGGAACEGLAVDGGARPCTNGYCVPPPLPNPGSGSGEGW